MIVMNNIDIYKRENKRISSLNFGRKHEFLEAAILFAISHGVMQQNTHIVHLCQLLCGSGWKNVTQLS